MGKFENLDILLLSDPKRPTPEETYRTFREGKEEPELEEQEKKSPPSEEEGGNRKDEGEEDKIEREENE